ncbi:MAG: HU family DNA-binding protein [Clostridia bacterium]|nr:HU family DNA-binding protein [Clostridia bacterium]
MNKTELIAALTEKTDLSKKDAEKALNGLIDVITEALVAGDKVQIVGFLSAEVKARPEREARNPQTKEPITIPASKAPVFKAGKSLRDAVNAK